MKRGSDQWAILKLKADALPKLIEDLRKLEEGGLNLDQCRQVKDALDHLIRATENSESSFWKPAVLNELRDFRKIYHQWNEQDEQTSMAARLYRRRAIEELRSQRRKIKKNLSKRSFDLVDHHDRDIATRVYQAFKDLCNTYPAIFMELKYAVRQFESEISLSQN